MMCKRKNPAPSTIHTHLDRAVRTWQLETSLDPWRYFPVGAWHGLTAHNGLPPRFTLPCSINKDRLTVAYSPLNVCHTRYARHFWGLRGCLKLTIPLPSLVIFCTPHIDLKHTTVPAICRENFTASPLQAHANRLLEWWSHT